ncbi:MAG: hypothetical protein EOO73_15020 [Myxococcales bacterium]|nr:MAG: hypothetical protein EOO73_15020 [Myxococcales bacterium]
MTTERAPFEALDAYQSGHMADDEAAAFEEELFLAAGAGTAQEATFLDKMSRILRHLAPRGGLDVGSSRAQVDELIASGLRVQVIEPKRARVATYPKIEDDAELVVTHVPIDVRGYDSVDVIIEKPDGEHLKIFRDIGWDPLDGTVYAVCEAPLARIAAAVGVIHSRIIGYRAGEPSVIAEFDTIAQP